MTKEDPLDSRGRKRNWVTGEKYSEQRAEWASKWSKFPLYNDKPRLKELMDAFKKVDVTILISGTGSGKTVLAIPLMLKVIDSDTATVAATMPKRATVLAAARTGAMTLDARMGEHVGYRFRESNSSDGTQSARSGGQGRLVYATDGYLLAQSKSDPLLLDYDAVVIDEAHERGVPSDMLILAVLRAQRARKERGNGVADRPGVADRLRLVIMSATIDPLVFERYFAEFGVSTHTVHVSGEPLHPVERRFLPPSSSKNDTSDVVGAAVQTARDIIEKNKKDSGKILLFVPTTRDVLGGCDTFRVHCRKSTCSATPCATLYGKQPQDQQLATLDGELGEGGQLIVATNVAESSLTIKDIKHVIDTGLQLNSSWMPLSHGTRLGIDMASQAQISQRMGRTGRTGPGTAHLMYTLAQFEALPKYPLPAISVTDVTESLLSEMLDGGETTDLPSAIAELNQLLTPPSADQIKGSVAFFRHYGFLDKATQMPTKLARACHRCMRQTRLDLWNALLVMKASPALVPDALLLASIMEAVQHGAMLWNAKENEDGSVNKDKAAAAKRGPPDWLLRAYSSRPSPPSGDHEALLWILRERAMEGQYVGLGRGAWRGIVRRAADLSRPRVIERCIQMLPPVGEPVTTIRSLVLNARSYHHVDARGKLSHVVAPSSKRPQTESWFGGGVRVGGGRGNKGRGRVINKGRGRVINKGSSSSSKGKGRGRSSSKGRKDQQKQAGVNRPYCYETLVVNNTNSTRLSILTWL